MDVWIAIGAGAFALTTVIYFTTLWSDQQKSPRAAHIALGVTLVLWIGLLVASLAQRGVDTRLWLGVSAFSLSGLYAVLLRRYPVVALGSFVTALSTCLAVLSIMVARPSALESEAITSWLLRVHIGLAFVGVTAFGFATSVSVLYLVKDRMLKLKKKGRLQRRLPPLGVLDRLSLRGIVVGFPFYTVALLLGSAQALEGEGGFELRSAYVLAVVSWLIYGVVLQARLTAGWRGRRAALLTTVGMLTALVVVTQYSLGIA